MVEIIELKKEFGLIHFTDLEIIGDLLQPMDKDADFVSGNNNYVWFYLIGKYFRPKVIVEMGTRFGYSMKAFVTGANHPANQYTISCYDMECDGIKTLDIFEIYFRNLLRINGLTVHRINTALVSRLNLSNVDLCLVDANHTTDGCYHECELGFEALKSGGVLVVDDVNYKDVKLGAEMFCEKRGLNYSYLPSLRGIYLIIKP